MMNAEERLDRENWYLTQELNRMPDPSLNPCEGIEQAYDRQRERIAELEAERDTLLALPEVSREELAIELCREIGAEVYQLVNGDIDQMCGIVGIHEPEGWLSVADALLATWRVVRRD